ncbi:MAG: hypothetical protein M5U34_33005 [Chloroflexi bacterium]|nr:hypothetical protein [Chloroflexota bacterium]
MAQTRVVKSSYGPFQFCNLSSAVARFDDDYDSLREKVELAAIIGTIQSMATYFLGLRPEWKQNCEEERLLGVDLNGQMDSPAAQDPLIQEKKAAPGGCGNEQGICGVIGNPSISVGNGR